MKNSAQPTKTRAPSSQPHLHQLIWAALLCSMLVFPARAEERLEVSWRVRQGTEFDSLIVNHQEIPQDVALDVERLVKFLDKQVPGSKDQATHVRFPDSEAPSPALPKLPGMLSSLFSEATSPDRRVEYSWKGRALRRYCIRCSSKGTRSDPEAANYWLDGIALGPWKDAQKRFLDTTWEKGAVVDILFDDQHVLSNKGIGLYLLRELDMLFWKHELIVNKHYTFRLPNDP
jgi:hypothetical protein